MKSLPMIALAVSLSLSAAAWPPQSDDHGRFISFDVPGAATTGNPRAFPVSGTIVRDMNNVGEVVGYYTLESSKVTRGFLRRHDGQIVLLDDPSAGSSVPSWAPPVGTFPNAINDAGAIVGYWADSSGVGNAFVRSSRGTFTNFSAPDATAPYLEISTDAYAINAGGVIAGQFNDVNGVPNAFIRKRNGAVIEFQAPNAVTTSISAGTVAVGINASGTTTGFYRDANFVAHTFLRQPDGTFIEFEVPGAGEIPYVGTFPLGIDNAGTICGYYFDVNYVFNNYVRTADGHISHVAIPGIAPSSDVAVGGSNRRGEFAGYYVDSNGAAQGFMRRRNGSFVLFSEPNAGKLLYQGTFPIRINEEGEVAGYYIDANNVYHGFIWSH